MLNILFKGCRVISFVGAGGKTTSLYALAHRLSLENHSVSIATTTQLALHPHLPQRGVSQIGTLHPDGYLKASEECSFQTDYLLVKADSSHGRPLKVPCYDEPHIHPESDFVLWVVGMDALHTPIASCCHHPQLAQALLRVGRNHLITSQDILQLALHGSAGRKGLPLGAKYSVLLNKAHTQSQIFEALWIQKALLRYGVDSQITSYQEHQRDFTYWFPSPWQEL